MITDVQNYQMRYASTLDSVELYTFVKTHFDELGFVYNVLSLPAVDDKIFRLVATHSAPQVRGNIAQYFNAPVDVLTTLVNDISPTVRRQAIWRVQQNPRVFFEVLKNEHSWEKFEEYYLESPKTANTTNSFAFRLLKEFIKQKAEKDKLPLNAPVVWLAKSYGVFLKEFNFKEHALRGNVDKNS